MLDQIELYFSVIGGLSAIYGVFRVGQLSERRSRRKPRQRKPERVLQFRTPGEAGLALAAEMNKKKPNPDTIDALVLAQNKLRRAA